MPIFHFLLLCLSPLMPTTSPTAGSMIFQFFFMVCLSRKTLRYSCCHLRHTASLHLMICFFLRSLSSMLSRSSSGIDAAFSSVIMFGVRSGSCIWSFFSFLFNWDSLHTRLNSHYKAWSYKKKKHKKTKAYRKSLQKEPVNSRPKTI